MDQVNISTFTELAAKIGITKNQLSVMLSDSYNPLKSRVVELCAALGVQPEAIMAHATEKTATPAFPVPRKTGVTAIELFAGAGGLALGLSRPGIDTIEYVEFDKTCCETLRANRPGWNVVCDDIHNVGFAPFKGRVDIVTGGFPLPGFFLCREKAWLRRYQGHPFP